MKYYFSDNCYWDCEERCAVRNGKIVKLTPSQIRIMNCLINNNNGFVSHERLYYEMTDGRTLCEGDKSLLSNQFTRKKENDKGLLLRIPEVETFYSPSRREGYKLSIPDENIIDESKAKFNLDAYSDIWHSTEYWNVLARKAKSDDPERQAKKFRLYLQGGPCSWPIMFSSPNTAPVRRNIVDSLKEAIDDELGVIVLTGAGGEGKTTILMQLCVELFREGKTVLFHAPTYKFDFPVGIDDCVLIVDNPPDTRDFKSFLSTAVKEGLTVVLASRSNEWNALKESLFDDVVRSIKEIETQKLSRSEAMAFARCIKNNLRGTKRSLSELETLFYKDSYGFLYASMLMAIYNTDSLEKIAEEIIDRISRFDKGGSVLKILAAIVFAEHCGVQVGIKYYRALCRELSVDDGDVRYYLRRELFLNGTVYQTRHESISKLFYKYLFEKGEWRNYIDEETQEDVIISLLEYYFKEISTAHRDFKPTDPQIIAITSLFQSAFSIIDYIDTCDFLTQRLFESCRQHGHAALARTFHQLDDEYLKNALAEKCYSASLPIWEIYVHWIPENIIGDESKADCATILLNHLCVEMNAPVDIWNIWTEFQENAVNAGKDCNVDSVRAIYIAGCAKFEDNPHWWMRWVSFEERWGNIGNEITPYLARWLCKEGCLKNTTNPHIWIQWGEIEERAGNIGNYDTVGTSAWIYKTMCERLTYHAGAWLKWADFVDEYPNIPDKYDDTIITYTSVDVLKRACMEYNVPNSYLWGRWGCAEESRGNIGNYELPGTAAWIFKEGCERHLDNDSHIWVQWSSFVERNTGVCDIDNRYSPSAILKEACLMQNAGPFPWSAWAAAEEATGNIGDYQTEHSAAWIYKECCTKHNQSGEASCLLRWAKFAYRFPMTDADDTLITAEYVLDYARDKSPGFRTRLWVELEEFKQSIGYHEK